MIRPIACHQRATPHRPEATAPESTVAVAALLGGREVREGGANP
jgi:hypothetical protein